MSKADWTFLRTTNKILKEGTWDTNMNVRPKWSDGTPAHTAKVFSINNTYKLSEEFPVTSLRYINWKAAIDEVLWIWQEKSNNVNDLNSHIWDEWADKDGSIGKAYGWQVRQKAKYGDNQFDIIDMIRHKIKNDPADRAMIGELFVHKDLSEMKLRPCVHGVQFDVSKNKLNMFVLQRSNDTLAAGNWNVVQYAALQEMLAKEAGLTAGELSHEIVNSHVYDRHIPFIVDLTLSRAQRVIDLLSKIGKSDIEFLSDKEKNAFIKFQDKALKQTMQENISFAQELTNARAMEIANAKYSAAQYEQECKRLTQTPAFVKSEFIVNVMFKYPNFNKVLSFAAPKLVLSPTVTNFYDFKSPLTKDDNGKIVANKDSSFDMKDYHYEEEGIKLQATVPVAI